MKERTRHLAIGLVLPNLSPQNILLIIFIRTGKKENTQIDIISVLKIVLLLLNDQLACLGEHWQSTWLGCGLGFPNVLQCKTELNVTI